MRVPIKCIYRPPTTYNTIPFTNELESLLRKSSNRSDALVIGDMNMNIFKDNQFLSEYLDMFACLGFFNYNPSEVTREDLNRNTKSNIDHIFVKPNTRMLYKYRSHTYQ